jgi:UDP-N-acetylmuramyl pentapeptide phosphotransferase/UDP-N-acetylglucosamine-1-phosphate transferase
MIFFITSFIVAFLVTTLIIRYQHLHYHFTADHELKGAQKYHAVPVPRVGGVCIAIPMSVAGLLVFFKYPHLNASYWLLLLATLPAFLGGIVEDFTKRVGIWVRLGLTMFAALLGFILLNGVLQTLNIPLIDLALTWLPFAVLFTCIAVGGVANAINIIDGYNGLASIVSVMIFSALAYVALQLGDRLIFIASVSMIGAILGFFIWNFPRGLIFLGDGGAYLIGFMIGELSVLLVARNPSLSPWFPLLLVIYPVFETIFSVYRKKVIRGTSPGMPDGVHLHMLIYKRLVRWAIGSRRAKDKTIRNSMTAPYLWILCSISIVPALLCWDNQLLLQIFIVVFILIYLWLYWSIVRFSSPSWLIFNKKRDRSIHEKRRIQNKSK